MKSSYRRLWDAVLPGKRACPELRSADISRRVTAALDAVPSERKRYMRHKLRVAAVFAAAAVALTGTALAVADSWNVLNAYFEGDTTPGAELVDDQPRVLQDDSYTLTVESSVSDGSAALLLIRLDARTEEAAAFMRSDDFNGIDLWSIYPLVPAQDGEGSAALEHPSVLSVGYSEVEELRTETSTTWQFDVDLSGMEADAVHIRMGYMDKGLSLDLPLAPARPVTLDIGASGAGLAWYDVLEDSRVTLNAVSISPLSFHMDVAWETDGGRTEAPLPPVLFRMADGSLRTMGQTLQQIIQGSSVTWTNDGQTEYRGGWDLRFRCVQDLSQISGVVVWGREYPLDGGASRAVEVDPNLLPFEVPAVDPQLSGIGCALPVRALSEGLGASCQWDGGTHTASVTYRGVTVSLTWGSKTALVDGRPVELEVPVFLVDGEGRVHPTPDGAVSGGTLCVEYSSDLLEAWSLWATLPYHAENWIVYP